MSPDDCNELSMQEQIERLRASLHDVQIDCVRTLQELVDRIDELTKHVLTLMRTGSHD